jgi:SAM-dependent methyltransferase
MIAQISPLCTNKDWTWLTIGDVNGWDAARILRMGALKVTASDLSTERLILAANEGLIEHFRAENAEEIQLPDESYDVVFCKEALHHFPRPWLGLYEMLRVAKQAVILIEPRDWVLDRGPARPVGPFGIFQSFSLWFQERFAGRSKVLPSSELFRLGDGAAYEPVGNYVFSISSRELEKIALGLDLPAVAFCAVNDHFEEGLSGHPATDSSSVFQRIRDLLARADSKTAAGVGGSSLLLAAIFKRMPAADLRDCLNNAGWFVRELPRNPYLGK